MNRAVARAGAWLLFGLVGIAPEAPADGAGVAPGIPEPVDRNVIVQLFNWRFDEIKGVLPTLRALGYSHVHVSPPQSSNERVWQWWGRYQPVDFSLISGPLGGERDFQEMNDVAGAQGIQIVVDVVFNHTVDMAELPRPDFVVLTGNRVTSEMFPEFEPRHFHERCGVDDRDVGSQRRCWLFNNLVNLKTEDDEVRAIARRYLKKLADLGADGFRFDAAKHIEPGFFPAVLAEVPGKYAFGEVVAGNAGEFPDHLALEAMDYYDFPLLAAMREAFRPGGDLTRLKDAAADGRALAGPKAVTFVRNHDIDRGQDGDRGIDDDRFNLGWDGAARVLYRTDVALAHAYILGREDGLPYIFVDMPTLPADRRDDAFDDPDLVAGIRFHNLCLAGPGGARRADVWRIATRDAIGWQRGTDRFLVINKADAWFPIRNLATTLEAGTYKEVRTGWPLNVQAGGNIADWNVPPRSAMRFVRVGD